MEDMGLRCVHEACCISIQGRGTGPCIHWGQNCQAPLWGELRWLCAANWWVSWPGPSDQVTSCSNEEGRPCSTGGFCFETCCSRVSSEPSPPSPKLCEGFCLSRYFHAARYYSNLIKLTKLPCPSWGPTVVISSRGVILTPFACRMQRKGGTINVWREFHPKETLYTNIGSWFNMFSVCQSNLYRDWSAWPQPCTLKLWSTTKLFLAAKAQAHLYRNTASTSRHKHNIQYLVLNVFKKKMWRHFSCGWGPLPTTC